MSYGYERISKSTYLVFETIHANCFTVLCSYCGDFDLEPEDRTRMASDLNNQGDVIDRVETKVTSVRVAVDTADR